MTGRRAGLERVYCYIPEPLKKDVLELLQKKPYYGMTLTKLIKDQLINFVSQSREGEFVLYMELPEKLLLAAEEMLEQEHYGKKIEDYLADLLRLSVLTWKEKQTKKKESQE